MLSLRLLSAAIGIPLLVLAIWLGSYWFLIPVTAIAAIGTWEFYRLVSPVTATPPVVFSIAIALGLTIPSYWANEYLLMALGVGVLISLAWQIIQEVRKKAAKGQYLGLAGPFYIGIPLSLAILLRNGADGRDWILLVLLATFSVDTGAYAVGRLIGRHKLAPRISPGKTWEGVVGGLLGGVGATFGFTLYWTFQWIRGRHCLSGCSWELPGCSEILSSHGSSERSGPRIQGIWSPVTAAYSIGLTA